MNQGSISSGIRLRFLEGIFLKPWEQEEQTASGYVKAVVGRLSGHVTCFPATHGMGWASDLWGVNPVLPGSGGGGWG